MHEIKTKRYTFSLVFDADVKKSCFSCRVKTPYQQLLTFLSFMNTVRSSLSQMFFKIGALRGSLHALSHPGVKFALGWTQFGLLRNLLHCLHVTSGVNFTLVLKTGAKFHPGWNNLFLTCKQKTKFNPGWKLFFAVKCTESFHPGWKMHVNRKYFTPRRYRTPVWKNACKLPLKNFAIFWIKKSLQHKYFPVNIVKFLRTAFFTELFRRLLLHYFKSN